MLPFDAEIPTISRNATADTDRRVVVRLRLTRFVWQSVSPRMWLSLVIFGLFVTFIAVIFLSFVASRSAFSTLKIEIPQYLLPGNPMPGSASCDNGDPKFRNILYCSSTQKEISPIRFTYDTRAKVILRSSLLVEDGTSIGDLIVAWGNPVGYRRGQQDTKIYWNGKSARLSILRSPVSHIRVILYLPTYCELPTDLLTWRGFVSVDRSPVIAEEASTVIRQSSYSDCE